MFENNTDVDEIDLKELFYVLKNKILVILLTAIVFAGTAGIITKFLITPVYSSTAQIYVVSKSSISNLTDLTMGNQLTQDYMVIVKSRPVLEEVIKKLKLKIDYKEFREQITVENPADTRLLQISVKNESPAMAQKITQQLAKTTARTVATKMDVKAPTIIENAYIADEPDSPDMKKNIILGALVGLVLCAGVISVRHILNDTIRKEEDIEKYLGLNTLAKIPLAKGEKRRTKKVRRAQ